MLHLRAEGHVFINPNTHLYVALVLCEDAPCEDAPCAKTHRLKCNVVCMFMHLAHTAVLKTAGTFVNNRTGMNTTQLLHSQKARLASLRKQ